MQVGQSPPERLCCKLPPWLKPMFDAIVPYLQSLISQNKLFSYGGGWYYVWVGSYSSSTTIQPTDMFWTEKEEGVPDFPIGDMYYDSSRMSQGG